jgi:hypothetical protein
MRGTVTILCALLGGLAFGPGDASGDTCFGGHPSCTGTIVFDGNLGVRLNAKSETTDGASAFAWWELGYLKGLHDGSAVGGALKYAADTDGHRFGPVVRYRRWAGKHWAADYSAGVYLAASSDYTNPYRMPSPTFEIGATYSDWFGVHVGLDVMRVQPSGTSVQSYAAARLGRWLTPIGTAVIGALIIASID